MRSFSQIFAPFFKVLRLAAASRRSRGQTQNTASRREALAAVMEAYRRGDYDAALQVVDGLRAAGDEAAFCFFSGTMLMHLGRLKEAESYQRRNVIMQKEPRLSALAYSTLGQNLQEQQRYEEALECFEAALRRFPGKGSVHRHMAELHLHRGDTPTEALKWANLAVEEERAQTADTPGMQHVNNLNLGEALATLAWAVAGASRNRAKVDALVAEALPLMGDGAAPPLALVHFQAGQAYVALSDSGKGAEHFEQAARLDPRGIWGKAAAAMAPGAFK